MTDATCTITDCTKDARARGWCSSHYERFRKYGDPLGTWRTERGCEQCATPFVANHWRQRFCRDLCSQQHRKLNGNPCSVDGCPNSAETKGWCSAHYRRHRYYGDVYSHLPLNQCQKGQPLKNRGPCSVGGCEKRAKTKGLCTAHYSRLLNGTFKTDVSPVRTFKTAGEGHLDNNGYKVVSAKGHPNAWKTGHLLEHTLVMSTHLGRPLVEGESIHHLNGVRDDNRIENLELWITKGGRHRKGQRVSDRIADAIETLERYAPERLATPQA